MRFLISALCVVILPQIIFVPKAFPNSLSASAEIDRVNRVAADKSYPLAPLTFKHFAETLQTQRHFIFPKQKRQLVDDAILGTIDSDAALAFQIYSDAGIYRINFEFPLSAGWMNSIALVDGKNEVNHNPEDSAGCASRPDLCTEPNFFHNFDSPKHREPRFQFSVDSVKLRFTAKQIAERPEVANVEQPSLRVTLRLTAESIPSIVEYFAFGQDPKLTSERLFDSLGKQTVRSIDLREILPPAPRSSLYRFPTTSLGEHDVCYNAASTFYNEDHARGNNSTELLESLINRYYCPRSTVEDLRFGDILYAGGHVVRYVMYDSSSHKHIVYQMNSGGFEAWRLLYLDDAFQYKSADDVAFRDTYDAYYRCK